MNARALLVGVAIGATGAYLIDPRQGRRRRALARDQVVHARRTGRGALDATRRDLANRARGMAAEARARLTDRRVDDDVLVERVRAKLGRVCSHPRAVEVHADDRRVILQGRILEHDLDRVLSAVAGVRGVRAVSNELDVHHDADRIPALQGEGRQAEADLDLLQPNWAPATQALIAAAGLAATGAWLATRARR